MSQLRVYRRARPRGADARYLVWGIVEKGEQGAISEAQLEWVGRAIAYGTGDVWVFSSVDSIDAVLGLLGCEKIASELRVRCTRKASIVQCSTSHPQRGSAMPERMTWLLSQAIDQSKLRVGTSYTIPRSWGVY